MDYNNNQNNPYNQPEYPNQPYYQPPYEGTCNDKTSVGLCILGWFIPIVGFIYFLVKRKERPKCAKSVLITSLISFAINCIVILVTAFGTIGTVFNTISENDGWEVNGTTSSSVTETVENDENNKPGTNNKDNKTDETTKQSPKGKTSSKWSDYTVSVNGKNISLPCSYADFAKTGYVFQNAYDADQTLQSKFTAIKTVQYNSKTLVVTLLNNADSTAALEDCYITEITASEYLSDTDIRFAGNLSIGTETSPDKIIKLFGEPDYVYNSEDETYDYHSLQYCDQENPLNGFEVVISDNQITELSVKNIG